MTTQPNLRCKNCWRPFALHTEGQDKHGGWHMWCPDCQDEYEPDDSPEARVYAAVDEIIAACRVYPISEIDLQHGRYALSGALEAISDAARAERTKP